MELEQLIKMFISEQTNNNTKLNSLNDSITVSSNISNRSNASESSRPAKISKTKKSKSKKISKTKSDTNVDNSKDNFDKNNNLNKNDEDTFKDFYIENNLIANSNIFLNSSLYMSNSMYLQTETIYDDINEFSGEETILPLKMKNFFLDNITKSIKNTNFSDKRCSSIKFYSEKSKYLAPSIININKKFVFANKILNNTNNEILMGMGLFYILFLKTTVVDVKYIGDTFILINKKYQPFTFIDNTNIQQNRSEKSETIATEMPISDIYNEKTENMIVENSNNNCVSNDDQKIEQKIEQEIEHKIEQINNDTEIKYENHSNELNMDENIEKEYMDEISNINTITHDDIKNHIKNITDGNKLDMVKKLNKKKKKESKALKKDDFINDIFSSNLNEQLINEMLKKITQS